MSWVIITLVVILVLFALAIVFAAFWYQLRQPKEVRLDPDEDEVGDEDDEIQS